METVQKANSFSELINKEPLVLVDFFATWCGPCKMMGPILEEVKSAIGSKAKVVKIDVDKNQHVAGQYQINGVPTLILFKDGKVAWRQSGVVPPSTLKDIIQQFS